jgi:hypothetical protein
LLEPPEPFDPGLLELLELEPLALPGSPLPLAEPDPPDPPEPFELEDDVPLEPPEVDEPDPPEEPPEELFDLLFELLSEFPAEAFDVALPRALLTLLLAIFAMLLLKSAAIIETDVILVRVEIIFCATTIFVIVVVAVATTSHGLLELIDETLFIQPLNVPFIKSA